MNRNELVQLLGGPHYAVEASVAADGGPQAAVIGLAVTDELVFVFDTLDTSRKHRNLRVDPRIAIAVHLDDAVTVQIEGIAEFLTGEELDRLRESYLVVFPDGHDRLAWPGIAHIRVRPTWIRCSDLSEDPAQIVEISGEDLWL